MKYTCHECAVPCHLSFKIKEDHVNFPPKYCPCDGEKVIWIKEEEGMTDLKPCPFCGAKAILIYCEHGIRANWAVECSNIHAHRIEFSGPQDEVINEWNRRVKE